MPERKNRRLPLMIYDCFSNRRFGGNVGGIVLEAGLLADTEMQAWAPQLSDLEIAAVITYERNSWANNTGDVIQPITIYRAR